MMNFEGVDVGVSVEDFARRHDNFHAACQKILLETNCLQVTAASYRARITHLKFSVAGGHADVQQRNFFVVGEGDIRREIFPDSDEFVDVAQFFRDNRLHLSERNCSLLLFSQLCVMLALHEKINRRARRRRQTQTTRQRRPERRAQHIEQVNHLRENFSTRRKFSLQ